MTDDDYIKMKENEGEDAPSKTVPLSRAKMDFIKDLVKDVVLDDES
jgi:hypothetical protein